MVYCHLDYWPFSLFSRLNKPFLTTLHGRLDLPELAPVYRCFNSVPLVSISDAQRRPLAQVNFVKTIHHGTPENLLTPRPVKQEYAAFLGRVSPEKGVDKAIRIAGKAGLKLKIAAKVSNRSQLRPPFRAQSRPLLGLIELRGMAFAGVGRLWVSGLPERPSRVWRRQATYP